MRRVCVFAGSSPGNRPAYRDAAEALGRELARRGHGLVYGGSSVGLMGALADAALAAGGEVIGVLPRGLFRREVAHTGLTEMRDVGSMHERKALMAELSDGVVALPGGMGTFDELFEILTWAQIGLHAKPVGLLDVATYFGPFLHLVEHAVAEGFVPPAFAGQILRQTEAGALLESLTAFRPVPRVAPPDEPLPTA